MSWRMISITSSVFGVSIIIVIVWFFLKLFFAGSAYYTENDWLEYEFYTPELLKGVPRISTKYQFDFVNVTGPDVHVFTVHFYGTNDSSMIRRYLISEGYEPQKTCDVEAECWRTHKNHDVVTIAEFSSPKEILLQISRRFRNQHMMLPMDSKGSS